MSNTKRETYTKQRPLPERLTTRGKVAIGALATMVAVTGGAELHRAVSDHHENKRIASNEQIIKGADQILDGTVYLGAGVNVRRAAEVKRDSGDVDLGQISNADYTVGKGKELILTRPILVKGKDGTTWAAFEKPGTDPKTLRDKADNLQFVALQQLREQSPELVHVGGYDKDPADANINAQVVAIDTIITEHGVGFEGAATDIMYRYVGSSVLQADTGK